jgi:putative sterol carrier protein
LAIFDKFKKAWNAFQSYEEESFDYNLGPTSTYRPDRTRHLFYNDRSIITAIYTRIAIDVANIKIKHVVVDEFGRYSKDSKSSLNDCLTLEPNIDQSPRAFRQDLVMTLFDKGVAAIVPVDTAANPDTNKNYDIYTLRVGEVTQWYPKHIRVSVYNESKGLREEITLPKRYVSIIENPLYAVMNEPNSTLQRLLRKLTLLDTVDEQSSSGKLDLIIQLPYTIKTEARKQQAEQRREDIEFQLKGSKYGIAYTDGTEKITQLNRPAENNLLKQVEYLTQMLYGQLGITEAIMNGTADEKAMLNYFNRTIEPILESIIESMERVFGASVGSANEKFKYFRDPFKLVSLTDIAQIADTFTRNEILTANEIRGYMGIPPATDPKADKLTNSNMPQPIDSSINQVPDQSTEPIEPPLDTLTQSMLDMKGNFGV